MSVALFLQFVPYLFQFFSDIPKVIAWIHSTKAELQQTNEWGPDEEASFRQTLLLYSQSPEEQPDPIVPPGGV